MTSVLSRNTPKIRHEVGKLSDVQMGVDTESVSAQCKALVGEGDIELVRDLMIKRYAQVIVKAKDEITGTDENLVYRANAATKMDFAAQSAILAGQQEIVRFYRIFRVGARTYFLMGSAGSFLTRDCALATTCGEVRRMFSSVRAAALLTRSFSSCATICSRSEMVLESG